MNDAVKGRELIYRRWIHVGGRGPNQGHVLDFFCDSERNRATFLMAHREHPGEVRRHRPPRRRRLLWKESRQLMNSGCLWISFFSLD